MMIYDVIGAFISHKKVSSKDFTFPTRLYSQMEVHIEHTNICFH